MDNVTHTLFAFTLARTPLSRAGGGTTTALVLASNAPDIDIVTTAGGAVSYLHWHRGPTHGPLGVGALSLVTAAIVWVGLRLLRRRAGAQEREPASFAMLVAVSLIGAVCHVLMDLPTSYGTRLLSPFSWRWFAIEIMPIVDIYLLVALVAGLVAGRGSEAARRRAAMIVLVVMAANYGIRFASHRQALAVGPRLLGPGLPEPCAPGTDRPAIVEAWPRLRSSSFGGQALPSSSFGGQALGSSSFGGQAPETRAVAPGKRCLVDIAAIPAFDSPFRWTILAQMSNGYEFRDVNVLDPRTRGPEDGLQSYWRRGWRYQNVWTPAAVRAADTDVGRVFLGFSRFPVVRTSVDASGVTTVRWDDMRFDSVGPGRTPRPTNLFTAVVRIAPDGAILQQSLGR